MRGNKQVTHLQIHHQLRLGHNRIWYLHHQCPLDNEETFFVKYRSVKDRIIIKEPLPPNEITVQFSLNKLISSITTNNRKRELKITETFHQESWRQTAFHEWL